MAKISLDGAQNVQVSAPIPCEKSPQEQLAVMEAYTAAHARWSKPQDELPELVGREPGQPVLAGAATVESHLRARREVECLKVLFPAMFRSIEPQDLIAGRLDFLPIGFGSVTSIGGVGHYCVFHKLRAFAELLSTPEEKARVQALYDYWEDHDVKALFCNDVLDGLTVGRFIDCPYPLMATARLSGMMLNYQKLVDVGVGGLLAEARARAAQEPENDFLQASVEAIELFQKVIDRQCELVEEAKDRCEDPARLVQLCAMGDALAAVRSDAPRTFPQALQLFWLWALCAGCINYGRMDTVLGSFLLDDIEAGRLTEDEAYAYVKSLWTLIENRRTTVNGRIIVGGYGRGEGQGPAGERRVAAADLFCRIALRVCRDCRYVEPQFTLRFNRDTPHDVMDLAYRCLAEGATYPTLYNDDVEVPAVSWAMGIPRARAEQYVPFGCTEFVIQGKSVGTPNILINLLKILQMSLNGGVDPYDGRDKSDGVAVAPRGSLTSFDALYDNYKRLLAHYIDLSVDYQLHSYDVMGREASFLFTSILMDDCMGRGRALLDGGVEILGGTNETYGNINASDSLYAIKRLVFDEGRYTLDEVAEACNRDFSGPGDARLRRDLLDQDKYGNDLSEVDDLACDLYEFVAKRNRDRGRELGMGYYLIVISNNQTNTDWGLMTAASPDGRRAGLYLNPANNPQAGAAKNGPTAMLNSLAKFDARYHGGSVQNIKLTPQIMGRHEPAVRAMFKSYFRRGGCQLMVTCVDAGELEHAQAHPEEHQDLIVRVAGYSARFVDLPRTVQDEVISRTLFGA